MKLPKEYLKDVKYWEAFHYTPWYTIRPQTKVILNFKTWWKRKKVFTFQWRCAETNENGQKTFREASDAIELRDQLREEFQ